MRQLRSSKYCGNIKGAVVVEFILVFSIIMLLFFSIIDYGIMMNKRIILSSAAREGGRLAAIEGGATPIVYERVINTLEKNGFSYDDVVIDIHPKKAGYGSPIKVKLMYVHEFITPMIRRLARSNINLEVEFTTRSENVK